MLLFINTLLIYSYTCILFSCLPIYCDLTELVAKEKPKRDAAPKVARISIPIR